MLHDISQLGSFLWGTALPRFAEGLGTTLVVSALGIIIGFGLGIAAGIGRSFGNAFVKGVSSVYVEVVRGIPLIVQILIWRYAIPSLIEGFTGHNFIDDLSSLLQVPLSEGLIWGTLAIGINSGAYQAEVIRAGINAIPTGQTEAGLSLGMNKSQVIKIVLFPQTMRMIIPPLINEFVIVIKDTSLMLAIGVLEITSIANSLVSQNPAYVFEIYLTNAAIYLAICFTLSVIARKVENRLAIAGYGTKSRRNLL